MLKRICLLFSFALLAQLVMAQSMSDDQVINFVKQQQEKGVNEQTIVSKLMQKGVTVDQLRRIRKKYQAQQEQLGAVDLTEEKKGVTKSRSRLDKQQAGENYQMRNNFLLRSQHRGKTGLYGTYDERRDQLTEEVGFFDIDSLIYYKDYFYEENEVFGRNIFNNPQLTFQPNMNMATPANYRLGAGDNVIIDVWGASQQTFEGEISPDGTITIEGVGPLTIGGMSVSEANGYLKNKLGQYFSASDISLSLGETRSIQVQVMGEVVAPGTYTLSSLSSAFNAMYAAGGVSDIGTLRSIKVYRGGRSISTIDVYDYILNGNIHGDVLLQDNDIIVVGTYDCLVNIRGKVKRPMFYEMKKNESVSTILKYAGGFTGDAYRKNVRLIRKTGAEYSIHTVDEFEMNGFMLCDGDSLFIDSVIPRFSNMVEIRGAVFHPGMFQMDGNINTVRELINAAEGLREDAFVARAVMHRQKEDLTLEVISVDVKGLMDGTVADIPLRKNDVLFVPSKLDMLGERTLKIDGEVNYPGTYMYAENTSLEDIVLQAGGLTEAASTVKVDVFRRIYEPSSMEDTDSLTQVFSFALKDGFVVDGEPGFTLRPFDEVVVRKSPSYNEQQNVTIQGSVNFEGTYSMTTKNYKLSDLVKSAGGLSSLAYAKGARLERVMTQEERNQRETKLRTAQIALYEEAMQSEKNYDLARADSLLNMKLDLGTTMPVAINLDKALAEPGGDDDITLRDGDKLIVPQYSNTVTISGEVMYPVSMNYKKGESLNYYIKRAGGYSDRARKPKVYAIYMNGSVELLSHHSSKAIQPGCEIVVPTKNNKSRMSTAEVMSIGTSATSIATMIITVANILK